MTKLTTGPAPANRADLTTIPRQNFTVKSYAGFTPDGRGGKLHYWNCECKCSTSFLAEHYNITTGRQGSCGCLRKSSKWDTHTLTLNGTTLTIPDWSIKTGVAKNRIVSRINKGWSVGKVLSPVKSIKPLTNQEVEKLKSLVLAGATEREAGRLMGRSHGMHKRVQEIRRSSPVPVYCRCGRLAGHNGWCPVRIADSPKWIATLVSRAPDINEFNKPPRIPREKPQVRPPYERPEIPYEFETELNFLTRDFFRFRSMDDVWFDDSGKTGHDLVCSNMMRPDELLMLKEENNSPDYYLDVRRREEFLNWLDRRNSAFYEKAA